MMVPSMERPCPSDATLLRLAYRGESMLGTLREGDCLWIAPRRFHEVCVGDVVAFATGAAIVAHRVMAVGGRGILTRGDAATGADPGRVAPNQLIGKVVMRERRGKRRAIAGGALGRIRGRVLHGVARMRRSLLFPLAPAYRRLRTSRWVSRVWKPRVIEVRFSGTEGGLVKFIHRGRTVACWFPKERHWSCRKPYDLLLSPPTR
jgi:hypothetical protein